MAKHCAVIHDRRLIGIYGSEEIARKEALRFLDRNYPDPPKNVYSRMMETYRKGVYVPGVTKEDSEVRAYISEYDTELGEVVTG